jgi:hypothetical protein
MRALRLRHACPSQDPYAPPPPLSRPEHATPLHLILAPHYDTRSIHEQVSVVPVIARWDLCPLKKVDDTSKSPGPGRTGRIRPATHVPPLLLQYEYRAHRSLPEVAKGSECAAHEADMQEPLVELRDVRADKIAQAVPEAK